MADPNELTTEVAPGGDAAAKKELRRSILRKLPGREVPTFIEQLRGPDGKPRLLVVERLARTPEVSDVEAGAFVLEARAASALQHPNIVKTRAISTRKDEIVLACDYVEGERLSELMRALAAAGSTLPTDVAVRIFIDVLSGLEALHGFSDPKSPAVKLTHGELTAANVLVGADGVSRLLHTARIRRPGKVSSGEGSIAPEVLAGADADRRADLFGIGVLLWQVLSGVAALADAADPDLIAKIRAGRVDRAAAPKDAPWAAPLAGVAARAMAIAPAERYPSASAMSDELLKIAGPKIAKPSQVAAFVQAKAGEKLAARRKLAERALHPSSSETKAAPAAVAPPPAAAPVAPAPAAAPAKAQEAPATTTTTTTTTTTATATTTTTTTATLQADAMAGQPIRSIGSPTKTPPEGAKPPAPAATAAPKKFAATIAPKPPAAPPAPKPAPAAVAAKPAAPPPKAPVATAAPKPPPATTATKTPPVAPTPQAPAATAPKSPAAPPAPKPTAAAPAQIKGPPPAPKTPPATPVQAAPPIAPVQAAPPIARTAAKAPAAPAKAPLTPIVKTIVPKTATASAPKAPPAPVAKPAVEPKAPPAPVAKPAVEPKTPAAAIAAPNVPKAPPAPRIDAVPPLAPPAPSPPAKANVMEIDGTEADSVPPSEPDGDRPTFPRFDPAIVPPGVTPPVTERPVPIEPKVVIASGRKDDGEEIDLTDPGPPSSTGAPGPQAARMPATVPVIRNAGAAARPRFDTPTAAPVTAAAQTPLGSPRRGIGATPSADDASEQTATIIVPVANAWRSRLIVGAVAAVCLVIGALAGFRALRSEQPDPSASTDGKPLPENAAKPAPAAAPPTKIDTPHPPGAATGAAATPPAPIEPPAQVQPPPQVQPPVPDEPAGKDPAVARPAQAVESEPPLFEPPARTPSGQAPSGPSQPSPRAPRANPEAPAAPPSPRPKFDPKRI